MKSSDSEKALERMQFLCILYQFWWISVIISRLKNGEEWYKMQKYPTSNVVITFRCAKKKEEIHSQMINTGTYCEQFCPVRLNSTRQDNTLVNRISVIVDTSGWLLTVSERIENLCMHSFSTQSVLNDIKTSLCITSLCIRPFKTQHYFNDHFSNQPMISPIIFVVLFS